MKKKGYAVIRGEHLHNVLEYLDGTRLKWDEYKGYSLEFAIMHDRILCEIVNSQAIKTKIISGLDDICNCGVCPKKREYCESEKLMKVDELVAAKYDIALDKNYSSLELISRLKKARLKQKLYKPVSCIFNLLGKIYRKSKIGEVLQYFRIVFPSNR